jgi:hypothetical protein
MCLNIFYLKLDFLYLLSLFLHLQSVNVGCSGVTGAGDPLVFIVEANLENSSKFVSSSQLLKVGTRFSVKEPYILSFL